MNRLIFDKFNFALDKKSQRKQTSEGYMITAGRVARTGIQDYMAGEIGITDEDPSCIIKVFRSPEQVFSKKSLDSYKDKDLTLEHPSELVDSRNYKMNAVGHVSSVGRRVGDYIEIDMVVKDSNAIEAIEQGKVQLSAGYSANFKESEGVHDGVPYTYEQTDININHVALVDNARAGSEARLFDASKKGIVMYKINFADKSVSVADKEAATLIQASVDTLTNELQAQRLNSSRLEAERDSALSELTKVKDTASKNALNERISSILKTKESAIRLIGDKFMCDSVDEMEIIRHTLSISHPRTNFSGKPDAYLQAYFDADLEKKEEDEEKADKKAKDKDKKAKDEDEEMEDMKKYDGRKMHSEDKEEEGEEHLRDMDEEEKKAKKKADDSLANFNRDMSRVSDSTDLRQKYEYDISQAWKKTIGQGG
jgi:hypothetical protein